MSVDRSGGPSPFSRLNAHLDQADRTCPDCGYRDDGHHWHAAASGATVEYRHVCPSCGAVRTQELSLGSD